MVRRRTPSISSARSGICVPTMMCAIKTTWCWRRTPSPIPQPAPSAIIIGCVIPLTCFTPRLVISTSGSGAVGSAESDMEDYQQRVVDEERELREKLKKLEAFVASDVFAGMAREDQSLLRKQHGYMANYLDILERRIVRFE